MASSSTATAIVPHGLASDQAAESLERFGPNELATTKHNSLGADLWHSLANPLTVVLLIAAAVSAFLGQRVDAAIIATMVVLSTIIDLAQTHRSVSAMNKLRAQVSTTATVLRDGDWKEVRRRDVVPGDMVRLSAGDLVPADARLVQTRDLYVQQSALTGESLPAEKDATDEPASTKADARNMVFVGTSVVSGTGMAEVVNTGARTAFGDIAARLAAKPQETAFSKGLRDFSSFLARTVLFLVLFLIIVSAGRHRDPLQSLLFAVALAVGLTPEFLPMITAVTLSKGAVAMSKKKVIVKHLASIEDLGSLDVICSDKTGTLTAGTMSLHDSLDAFGRASSRPQELAYINSKFQTGIRSPLDEVILEQPAPEFLGYIKSDEIPFDFERRRLSVIVTQGAKQLLITKGAPEGILPLLSAYELEGQVVSMNEDAREHIQSSSNSLGSQGFRVLAVAYAEVPTRASYSVNDEQNLVLAGFLTFADEPLADAAEALASLRRDGVELKVISGDNDRVTAHVCTEVGVDAGRIVTGDDLEKMTDPALQHAAENARVSPVSRPHRRIASCLL